MATQMIINANSQYSIMIYRKGAKELPCKVMSLYQRSINLIRQRSWQQYYIELRIWIMIQLLESNEKISSTEKKLRLSLLFFSILSI